MFSADSVVAFELSHHNSARVKLHFTKAEQETRCPLTFQKFGPKNLGVEVSPAV